MSQGNQQGLVQTFRLAVFGLLLLGLFSYLMHQGRLTDYVGESGRTIVLAIELGVVVLSSGMALLSQNYKAVLLAALAYAYIVFQANLFASNFHTDVNLNAQSSFFGWLSVPMFAIALTQLPHRQVVRCLYGFVIAYAAFYLLIVLHVPGFAPRVGGVDALSIGADPTSGRQARFFLLAAPMAFAIYYSFCRWMIDKQVVYLAPLALCLVDVYLSYSRAATGIIVGVLAMYVILRNVRLVGLISSLALFAVMGALLIGLKFPEFQPFSLFGNRDGSATIRGLSYELVRSHAPDHWLFGIGFVNAPTDSAYAMSSKLFFSSDLGAVGVFNDAGVVGVAILALISLLAANASGILRNLQVLDSERQALALAGVACALFGVIAPDLWSGPANLFAALFLAVWVVGPRLRGQLARSQRGGAPGQAVAGGATPVVGYETRGSFTPR